MASRRGTRLGRNELPGGRPPTVQALPHSEASLQQPDTRQRSGTCCAKPTALARSFDSAARRRCRRLLAALGFQCVLIALSQSGICGTSDAGGDEGADSISHDANLGGLARQRLTEGGQARLAKGSRSRIRRTRSCVPSTHHQEHYCTIWYHFCWTRAREIARLHKARGRPARGGLSKSSKHPGGLLAFLMVSTTAVLGRLIATLTGMNWPEPASLPIFVDLAIGKTLS